MLIGLIKMARTQMNSIRARRHVGKHGHINQDSFVRVAARLVRQRNCTSSSFQVEKVFRHSVDTLLAALVEHKIDKPRRQRMRVQKFFLQSQELKSIFSRDKRRGSLRYKSTCKCANFNHRHLEHFAGL